MVRFIITAEAGYIYPIYYLHSNMVRFIIIMINYDTYYENYIYIPIWLDLLYYIDKYNKEHNKNLHSNMVRFIIRFFSLKYAKLIFSTY